MLRIKLSPPQEHLLDLGRVADLRARLPEEVLAGTLLLHLHEAGLPHPATLHGVPKWGGLPSETLEELHGVTQAVLGAVRDLCARPLILGHLGFLSRRCWE